jgi:ATP-binding cassette, subfamily B, bacterial PglK
MQTFKKLLFLLSPHERIRGGLLLIMILLMAFLEMIGVASILPFMAVLANPNIIETNLILSAIYTISKDFGVQTEQQFLFALGVLVFVILISSLIFKSLTVYAQLRFTQMRTFSIGKRLVKGYLYQPYSWFLSQNSADIGNTILQEVQEVVSGSLGSFIDLIAKCFVIIFIITLLFIADPKLAFTVGLSLVGAYVIIFYFVRKTLEQIGKKRFKNNQLRFSAVIEAFSASKEVKVRGLEEKYINLFSKPAQIFAKTKALGQVIAQLPRFLLEGIAFGGILLIILNIMRQTGNLNNSLPIISLYVFAGYRLMPALQQIYSAFTALKFTKPALDKLYNDLKNLKPSYKNNNEEEVDLHFNEKVTLNNIHYNYPNTKRTTLNDVNLTIPAKSIVGFMGTTGSGKTTVVDIILGLLEAQKGSLEVDEQIITNKNSRAWQKFIGYVPQHIYLSDNTIAANIAFGQDPSDVNDEMVKKACKIANLHEFVVNELPQQYNTEIGERGVRLSGGQRQRIGIARALYYNSKVLILDEATSALDNETEQAVVDEILNFKKDITIIMIAHRLNTLRHCDTIYKFENGQIIEKGTYADLVK